MEAPMGQSIHGANLPAHSATAHSSALAEEKTSTATSCCRSRDQPGARFHVRSRLNVPHTTRKANAAA
jgi:hypothetical protein